MAKIKWKLPEAPTGPYRSFHKRDWHQAFVNGDLVAMLNAEQGYSPAFRDPKLCPELKIHIFDYSQGVQKRAMRTLKARAWNIDDAKRLAEQFLAANPHYLPAYKKD